MIHVDVVIRDDSGGRRKAMRRQGRVRHGMRHGGRRRISVKVEGVRVDRRGRRDVMRRSRRRHRMHRIGVRSADDRVVVGADRDGRRLYDGRWSAQSLAQVAAAITSRGGRALSLGDGLAVFGVALCEQLAFVVVGEGAILAQRRRKSNTPGKAEVDTVELRPSDRLRQRRGVELDIVGFKAIFGPQIGAEVVNLFKQVYV